MRFNIDTITVGHGYFLIVVTRIGITIYLSLDTGTLCHPRSSHNIVGYDSINLGPYIDWEEV